MSQFSKFAVFDSPFLRLLLCFVASQPAMLSSAAETLDFHRDVQPILAGYCIECHGPDAAARKGKLRLDRGDGLAEDRGGYQVLVPGKPEESELIARIMAADPDERMPPAEFTEKKPLEQHQVETLKRWIAEGAKFEKHWAFATPVKRAMPEPGGWGHNEIDRFVHARMKAAGMQPQTAASKEKIMRRVSFDLTGLPPTLAEVESFLLDKSGDAYGKVVDRLLESPRFGERWAVWWLDGAHYGDSHGYDNDLENSQWPWRNWVIDAFNANKPFNEFTIEQLAGDLLPNATEDQILATAFNRNHRIQTEDGAIDEEWRAEYVMDRVETMGSVWMGLTLGCARCHDHKYDPVSQKDFFQLFALFNNLDEKGFVNNLSGAAEPRMRYREAEFTRQAREIEERHKGKEWEQERKKLEDQFPHVMIMREMGSLRKAFVVKRGQYDAPEEEVKATLPHAFSPAPEGNVTRLDLKLFNNLDEKGFVNNLSGAAEPRLRYREAKFAQQVREIEERHKGKEREREQERKKLEEQFPHVMIMREMGSPRKAFVLKRGQYDAPGEEVKAALPQAFSPAPEGNVTRLDLARWLVDGRHPLTARVVVNRLWEQLFGAGLVKGSENLGTQADWPSHPELLDWLAVDFVESGWDMKRLLKKLVMSATYRQSPVLDESRLSKDPDNQMLSRGPRGRLAAEMVRDQALFLSDLFVEKLGGPSWWVYQPDGLWQEVDKRGTFVQDRGEKLYRRSLYSRIRKTVAPPSMLLFDMPSREMCTVKRTQTNTPLQALALLNEVTYVEAAKKFAERMLKEGGSARERIAWGFRTATARAATAEELAVLLAGFERRLARFREDPKGAENLLSHGDSKVADGADKVELAALTTVANVLLNLDEMINK